MVSGRVGRVARAALLLGLGIQGLGSPVARTALRGPIPDCVEAPPVAAWAGTGTRMLMLSSDCPHGSYAPAPSYGAFTQATLAGSLTATLLGLVALLLALGLRLRVQRRLREVQHWFARRARIVAAAVTLPSIPRLVPVVTASPARPSRVASNPNVRRGPPSCSC